VAILDGLGIVVVLIGQLLLIGLLLIDRRRRRRAEESLKAINGTLERRVVESNERLLANKARYHSLFNSMTEGFALLRSSAAPTARRLTTASSISIPPSHSLPG
jgi:hypothetical protein